MPIDSAWFVQRLADRRLSQRQLARLMGMDPSAVSLMFRGKRRMTVDEAAQIAVLLQSTTTEVMEAAGVPITGGGKVPITGYLMPDSSVRLEAEGLHDTVDSPPGLPADAVAIQARTARSAADTLDGWIYFMGAEHGQPERAVGSLACCAVQGNGLLLAHVRRGYRAGAFNLTDLAGREQTNVALAWASPILWVRTTP